MIEHIGRFMCSVLRDAMHIAAQFNDTALMWLDGTEIKIRAKNVHNSAIVWIDIPTSEFRADYSSSDSAWRTDTGINCEKLYRMLNAYEPDETIRFSREHRDGVGELTSIEGTEGTLWTYQTSVNRIDPIPGTYKIRSAHTRPASGVRDAEYFRDWLTRAGIKDNIVSFRHLQGSGKFPLSGVSEPSIEQVVLSYPEVPDDMDSFRTSISLKLLQRSLAPKCIYDDIKFSFGNDTPLFMDTQVNGCSVVMAIAPRIDA